MNLNEIVKVVWKFGEDSLDVIQRQDLEKFLTNFDPSLFQNIILAVLAIFIPFGIVFLTGVLNTEKETRNLFEKMVLSDEILKTRKIFWLSIFGIVFFSFFSVKVSFLGKIISIIVAIILIRHFWKPFRQILRFSEGYTLEFELSFLKKLKLSKIFYFKNKEVSHKLLKVWNAIWSEKMDFNEKDFTDLFIFHIDDAIKHKNLNSVPELVNTYVKNIERRDLFLMGNQILPKIFEWNEFFWNEHQSWMKRYDVENINFFKKRLLNFYRNIRFKKTRFYNWYYFKREVFSPVIKLLLYDEHGSYQLFDAFQRHFFECEKKVEKIKNKLRKEDYLLHVDRVFADFFLIFFNEIADIPNNNEIWNEYFPNDWKVSLKNKDKRIVRVLLIQFLLWSNDRLFVKTEGENFDKDLSEVINGIFINVNPSLFTAFMMLFSSSSVREAVEKVPNFYILPGYLSWSSSVNETKENIDVKLLTKYEEKVNLQKDHTIQVILNFFLSRWQRLQIFKEDLNEEELKNWEIYTLPEKRIIEIKVKKQKLENLRLEIQSNEMTQFCISSKEKMNYKEDFLELVNLLIENVK